MQVSHLSQNLAYVKTNQEAYASYNQTMDVLTEAKYIVLLC